MAVATTARADTAAAMNGIYRYQRHIYDATRYAYLLGRDRLIETLDVPVGGRVLEIGCGTGRNLVCAARRYPEARFYGIDVSSAMLATAERSILRAGCGHRVICAEADATSFDTQRLFGIDGFDRVFVSYTFSMIPNWEKVLPEAIRALAPSGELHIVDFGDFAGMPRILRAVQRAWLARFSVTPIPHITRRIEQVGLQYGHVTDAERLYSGYAVLVRLSAVEGPVSPVAGAAARQG